MLRRKNKLMRAGRVEEAGALSARIGKAIQRRCKTQLSRYDGKTDAASMWAAVRRLTGRTGTPAKVDGVTAEVLNGHYADISTDPLYTKPALKTMADDTSDRPQCISEWKLFRMLDTLRPTSAGLDGLPSMVSQGACIHTSAARRLPAHLDHPNID